MATTKPRVSVIRIPRQSLNQTNPIPNPNPTPTENHYDTDKDTSTTHLKLNHVLRIDKKSPIENHHDTDKDTSTSHLKLLQVPHVDKISKNKKEQNVRRKRCFFFILTYQRNVLGYFSSKN